MKALRMNRQGSVISQNYCENKSIKNPFLWKRPFDINVADTQSVFAYGLFSIVTEHPTLKIASFNVTKSFQQVLRWGLRYPESLQIVNPKLLGAPGLQSIKMLRGIAPRSTIVMLLENEEEALADYFLKHGANAVISKQAELGEFEDLFVYYPENSAEINDDSYNSDKENSVNFFEALSNLTDRQLIVLEKLRNGILNKQIAHELNVAEVTVKHHISKLLNILGFHSRAQLVAMLNNLQFTMQKPKCYGIQRLRKSAELEQYWTRDVRDYLNYGLI